jgi:hypothetical protein
MFALAYMGLKRILQMLSLHAQGLLLWAQFFFARVAEALEGAAPRLFRPMYAGANMGHPSRERDSLFAPTTAPPMNSPGLLSQPDFRSSGLT